MSDLTYHPMSTPHRWMLGVVFAFVTVLTVVMMARANDTSAPTASSAVIETVVSDVVPVDEDYQPRNPFPLPAGPRRFANPQ